VDSPPGPKTVRAVFDLYLRFWGDRFTQYTSTALGNLPRAWNTNTRLLFEQAELPRLRSQEDWGYAFADDRRVDSWMFMVHGYKPFTEAGKASFYRFEFDWQLAPGKLVEFTQGVLSIVRCVSGYAGYMFQGLPRGRFGKSSFDQIFAWARRYWGVEAQDLDVTVDHMLAGYKCPSWLTIIGQSFAEKSPDVVPAAQAVAFRSIPTSGGMILQAGPAPELIDRNRNERFDTYAAIAHALLPIQVQTHAPFGGSRWTDDNTMAWLRRFTDPDAMV
jgi:hypothetical protein